MNNGLYSGIAAARSWERRLEAITSNLANLETPAYKRVSTATHAFRLPGSRKTDEHELFAHARTDFGQGELEPSSNHYHLALRGPGFFAVEGPEGELLTRNGAFRVDERGTLLTHEGYPVSWAGPHAPIEATGEPITVDAGGSVRQAEKEIGRIRIADYAEPAALEKLGAGYFQARPGMEEQPSAAAVHQGMLETSNVSGIDELVALVSVQRNFENAQSVMRLIDQSYRQLTAAR